MRRLGQLDFPDQESREESQAWRPIIRVVELSPSVIAVARTRIEGAWKAYCDTIKGVDRLANYNAVLDYGCAVSEPIARAMFPEFDDVPYAH